MWFLPQSEGWNSTLSFDHDLSRFPLYGLHALASCESCHTNGRYASLPHDCNDCHRTDDTHKGALGKSCSDCHNANGWRLWKFDHETTDFSLTGAHDGLACNSCHLKGPADKTSMECVSCHLGDDVHHGRFWSQLQPLSQHRQFPPHPHAVQRGFQITMFRFTAVHLKTTLAVLIVLTGTFIAGQNSGWASGAVSAEVARTAGPGSCN